MSADTIVRALLEQAPGEAICNACLAFACSTSLTEMMDVTAALIRASNDFASGPGTCLSCRRTTTTVQAVKRSYPNDRQLTPRSPRSTSSTTR